MIEEEEELHLTVKKEESFDVTEQHQQQQQVAGPPPEWQQINEVLHTKLAVDAHSDAHFIRKKPHLPHRWDQSKATLPLADSSSTSSRAKDSSGCHGGRVGKVLPMCKQEERECIDLSADKDDFGVVRRDVAQPPSQPPAYCKAGQVVMSPLAKKKLLSQVCESNPYSFTTTPSLQPAPPTAAPQRALERRVAVEEESTAAGNKHSDGVLEVAPVFRPSVIQHAAARPPAEEGGEAAEVNGSRPSHTLKVKRPWQPYLPRPHSQDGGEGGEALVQGPAAPLRGYTGDCYSSPHLHSLYRQTESCLGQERVERQGHLPPRGAPAFALEGGEGLAFRSHYSQRTPEDEPRDYSVSKPLAQRGALSSSSSTSSPSSFQRPPFPSLPYPSLLPQGLDSHPKACRVSPMKPSAPPQSSPDSSPESSPPFNPKASALPTSLGKRGLAEVDGSGEEESPERKVRVVTPVHPAGAARRGDPEELKPAGGHLPEGHPGAPAYPHHTTPFYPGMFTPGGLLSPDALQQQQHPGLQYLKSQSAVSPLVPPLAFHSMMLQRHLMASGAAPPHHFYRHPGGAALYGDLLHHLYPLSTLPPPQLSSVHPSTRL